VRLEVGVRGVGCASLAGLLMAGVSTAALAAKAPDPGEARMEQLEAEIQQLKADNQHLHQEEGALQDRAERLQGEVEELKQGQASQTEALQTQQQQVQTVQASIPPAPSMIDTMLAGRPVFASANGRFTLTLHTVMQLDTAAYFQGPSGPIATDLRRSGPALGASAANVDLVHARDLKDGTDFRRARVGVDGTAFGDWDYRLLLDFGGSGVENTGQLYETWIQYSGFKPLRLRAGAFPPTIGLEDSASTSGMPFIERTAIEDMARGFAAGDTRIGAQAYAYQDHWLVSGALTGRTIGVINTGTAAAAPQTFGDQLGLVGRVALSPFYGDDWMLHLGAHGSYVVDPPNASGPAADGSTLASARALAFSNTQQLRVDGTKLINTGNIAAHNGYTAGLEFAAQKGPFILQSEYEQFGVSRADIASHPTFHGWYVEGLWELTGDPRVYSHASAAFDAPVPVHPFSWSDGTWGAFELGVRYADADLDYHAGVLGAAQPTTGIRGGDERNVSVDLNWFPNSVVKFMLDYEHVELSRLSPNALVYQTPTGAPIGQTYDAVAVRSQFSF
jgi:phosphate-selective porin OprO/OprP